MSRPSRDQVRETLAASLRGYDAPVARHDRSHGPAETSASNLESIKNMSSVICRTAVVPARASVAPRAAEARAAVTSAAKCPKPRTAVTVTFPSARAIRDVSVRMGRKGMLADLMDDGTDTAGDPVAKVVTKCPCGSGEEYASCCQPHHDGTAPADAVTPEAIVRARFSAYVKNLPKYIVASTHPDSKDMKRKDDPAEAREQLEKDGGLAAAAGELGKGMGSVASRLQSANPLEAVSLLGLDQEYVKSEMKMLDSLRKGTAVENHLEPSYFVAMTSALDAALAGSDDGEGDAPE